MTDLPTLISEADDVVACLEADEKIHSVTVNPGTSSIFRNIVIHVRNIPTLGEMLDLAKRADLEGVQVVDGTIGGNRYVRGKRGELTVELYG